MLMGTHEFIFSTTQWITILIFFVGAVTTFYLKIMDLKKDDATNKEELNKCITNVNLRVEVMEVEIKTFKETMIEIKQESNRIREDYNKSMADYMKLNALQHDSIIKNQDKQGAILGEVRDSIREHLATEKALASKSTNVKNKNY